MRKPTPGVAPACPTRWVGQTTQKQRRHREEGCKARRGDLNKRQKRECYNETVREVVTNRRYNTYADSHARCRSLAMTGGCVWAEACGETAQILGATT